MSPPHQEVQSAEGHLDRQVAVLQAPPLGLHTFLPLTLPVSQDHREMEECELFLRQSPDRELERLIKLVKQNAIIEASSLQIPPEKTSFSPYLFPKCERAFSSYLNSLSGIIQGL